MEAIPRFLVLRGGAIGDFILTLPVLQALRERWPTAHIELMCYPHIGQLVLDTGLVEAIRSLDEAGMAEFFSLRPEFTEEQVAYIRSFDIIITYLHDPGHIVRENLLRAGARQVIYGTPMVTEGHAIDFLLKPLEELALYPECAVPCLRLSESSALAGGVWLQEHHLAGRVTAIHPGSGSPKKNWPAERFGRLAEALCRDGGGCFFIFGEADRDIEAALSRQLPRIPVLSGVPLTQVAAVLANCDAYVGNDSGITHIAAALGIPVVALFGPSDHTTWAPRGEHVCVLRDERGDLADVPLEAVVLSLSV